MRKENRSSLLTAIVLFLLLYLPLMGMFFPNLNYDRGIVENRYLAEFPAFHLSNIASYPEQFDKYFNDHFGYRKLLIRLDGKLKEDVFGISNNKDQVIKGKSGWLFYTGNDTLDDYRGVNPLTDSQLEKWRTVLESKKRWLDAQGIKYLFVVAPNKSSIYPEYLPGWLKKVKNETPLDQLLEYLASNTDIEILDLRNTFKKEKTKNDLLYYTTDTHWNQLGAFVAYARITDRLATWFPQITPLTLTDMRVDLKEVEGGDLAKILGIQADIVETAPGLTPLAPKAKKQTLEAAGSDRILMASEQTSLPRAVVFRDSFGQALIPFLSENFSHVSYVSANWKDDTPIEEIIRANKPDVVIEEWVERHINTMRRVSLRNLAPPEKM